MLTGLMGSRDRLNFRAALRADPRAIHHPLGGWRESWTGICDLYRVGSHDRCLWAGPTGTRAVEADDGSVSGTH
jgi:hypothetical protein